MAKAKRAAKPELLPVTHGVRSVTLVEGIERIIEVNRVSDGSVYITFTTRWDEKSKPVVTRIRLSPPALDQFLDVLLALTLNPEQWRVPHKTEGKPDAHE